MWNAFGNYSFFRSLFGPELPALPLLIKPGLTRCCAPHILVSIFLRGVVSARLAMLGSFWALSHLPLATAVSISYSTPLFVTIGAVFLLGEVVRARRWSAVAIGFAGVLIIMRPGVTSAAAGSAPLDMLVALAAAAIAAGSYISIKFLARTEPADAVVIYTPGDHDRRLLRCSNSCRAVRLGLARCGWLVLGRRRPACSPRSVRGLRDARAYQAGDISALIPINFIQLPIVALCAYFVFGQALDAGTAIGAGIIVCANVYIARREAMLTRRTVSDPLIAASGSGQSG